MFARWLVAELKPDSAHVERNVRREDQEIIEAMRQWAASHGRPPAAVDWLRATRERPSSGTVRTHFGKWGDALVAAGLSGQERS